MREICKASFAVYELAKTRYQAAIIFHGAIFTLVDWLRKPSPLSAPLFAALSQLQQKAQEEDYQMSTPGSVYISRCLYQGKDSYQQLGAGILPVNDNHVAIPSEAAGRAAFQALQLGHYVTLNNGNGTGASGNGVAKAWPNERFEQWIALFHEAYPAIEVVQLGMKNAIPLAGVDQEVFGATFGTVREVLAHTLLHIDIEGGLVHLATQVGTKCVVLFGPTPVGYYGYPQNINITAGDCQGCIHLYPKNINRCARDLGEPECMYSITPEMVMEAARGYLASLQAK